MTTPGGGYFKRWLNAQSACSCPGDSIKMREGNYQDSRSPGSNGRHSAIMSATMNCPGCQTPLRMRDEMAGKKIKCPRCAQVVTVPALEVQTLEEVSSAEEITADPPAPKSTKEPAGTRPCPACGERISVTARRCRHCQADVVDEDDAEDDEDVSIRARSKYKPCPRCGETAPNGWYGRPGAVSTVPPCSRTSAVRNAVTPTTARAGAPI